LCMVLERQLGRSGRLLWLFCGGGLSFL
jgi:hypothetical protein